MDAVAFPAVLLTQSMRVTTITEGAEVDRTLCRLNEQGNYF